MKNPITLFLALFLMVGTAFATENEKEKGSSNVTVIKWKSKVHQLFYEGSDEKVKVRVLNDEGIELWSGKIKNQKGFALPLNFKKQDPGTYSIEVRDSKITYIQEIEVSEE